MRSLLLATLLISSPAWAESAMVATLLPPPVEAMTATPQPTGDALVAVPVLKQPLLKGETITAENLATQTILARQAYASTITTADELIGQQAVRPLVAGQPINRLHVRLAPMVSRNQAVTLVFRRGGVELSGRATALEDGQLGQSIRVINPATRSTTVGTIASAGIVEIN